MDSILIELAKSDPELLKQILIVSQVEVRVVSQEEFDAVKLLVQKEREKK